MNLVQNKIKKIIFSKSQNFREQRNNLFIKLTNALPRPLKIVDIGGTVEFWQKTKLYNNSDYQITLINLDKQIGKNNLNCHKADGCNLKIFKENQFDITFSNSTIEHLNCWQKQIKMAKEIRRVGKFYFIQTPNYYFPIEPHFHLPFFQFIPDSIKKSVIRNSSLEGRGETRNENEIEKNINSINLLTRRKLRKLFPEGKIANEKYWGITKSFIAYSQKLKQFD